MGFWLRLLLLFSRQVVSHSLWTHGLQHARLLCPLLFLRVCSNSCPLSRWCYLTAHLLLPFSPFAFSLSLSIRIFSNELALRIRWSKHWSFSFSISPSNEYLGLRFPPPYHRCENDSLAKFGIRETSYQVSTSSTWMKTLTWNMKVVHLRGSELSGLLLKLETLCMNCS